MVGTAVLAILLVSTAAGKGRGLEDPRPLQLQCAHVPMLRGFAHGG